MSHIDPGALFLFLELTRPLAVRTIAFDIPTFDKLKDFQRRLEGFVKRRIGNAETLKYLIHTHPEIAQPEGSTGDGC
jgi:hypothetical protein